MAVVPPPNVNLRHSLIRGRLTHRGKLITEGGDEISITFGKPYRAGHMFISRVHAKVGKMNYSGIAVPEQVVILRPVASGRHRKSRSILADKAPPSAIPGSY